ncbi:Polyadenylate-binding protein-interacting protein 8 [Striga hermonthica]|uniref:Polyadenylate-binding protein-interacting protein 8 n=1 Tax=Striga hermonthica TaxID=68872 RepID=A0A9N7P4G0_STRHE|nr:Polyadenylate-binding protein-interacting protein 8 [Striga hermonthica]
MQMKGIVDMLQKLKLNPMAKEFVPSSYHQGQMGAQNFVPSEFFLGNDGFSNNRKRRNNYNQVKNRMGGRASRAQREDSIRQTVYVSDIDHNITEEQLAALFSGYGLSEDEREMCARIVYCTNIDKKRYMDSEIRAIMASTCHWTIKGRFPLTRLKGMFRHDYTL